MPAKADPHEDAAALLERRRAQNRLAQQRFRQKKLALKAMTGEAAPSSASQVSPRPVPAARHSSGSTASTSSAGLTGGRDSSSPNNSTSTSDSPPSNPSSSVSSWYGSDKASSPLSSLSPNSPKDIVLPTTAACAALSSSSSSSSPSPPSAVPQRTDRDLLEVIGSSSAMPTDNEVDYFLSVIRETQQGQWEQQTQRAGSRQQPHQQQQQQQQLPPTQYPQLQQLQQPTHLQYCPPQPVAPAPSMGPVQGDQEFADLLRDFNITNAVAAQRSAAFNPAVDNTGENPSERVESGCVQDGFNPWHLAQEVTNEKGMLAMILLESGEPNLTALRQSLDPTADHVFHPSFSLAKAFFFNCVALGYLDDDLRSCYSESHIRRVWTSRTSPYLAAWSSISDKGEDVHSMKQLQRYSKGPTFDGSAGIAPSQTTVSGNNFFGIPASLSEQQEVTRLRKLREATNLHPTKLQLEVPHGLIIDSLPWPSVRDGLIRLLTTGIVTNEQIKGDLMGKPFDLRGEGFVFTIHGDDPSDPEAWEMSEFWALKYAAILEPSVIKRTNFWRRLQGKSNLDFNKAGQDRTITDALARLAASNFLNKTPTTTAPPPPAMALSDPMTSAAPDAGLPCPMAADFAALSHALSVGAA